MHLPTALLPLLFTATHALDTITTSVTSFNFMLARGDALSKRQGYTPEQRNRGRGNTCQEACGPNYVQCPLTENKIYCHQPSTGTHCCSDGTGNACRAGYHCTTNGRDRTYCCPNGIQSAECARLYSLTISLVRESSTAVRSVPGATQSAPAVTPAFESGISCVGVSTSTRKENSTSKRSSSSRAPSSRALTSSKGVNSTSERSSSTRALSSRTPTSVVLSSSSVNGTVSASTSASGTSSGVIAFTGAAAKVLGAGMAIVVGAVGFVL